MNDSAQSTMQKALEINLDHCKYGTIAEIGAGQEVARFFFQAGGAAGTVAKSMSAYDMQFSDSIYGEAGPGRYVSRARLERMLEVEFDLVMERIKSVRPRNSTFFAFADTLAAQSYKRRSECHGWMGIRLQLYPEAEPSDIIIHVRMLDEHPQDQQKAIGMLGVNLIYGAYMHHRNPEKLIESLFDNLGPERLEIDMINFRGPYFEDIDNRLMALHLVNAGLTHAVVFSPSGEVMQPSEVFYKKNILVYRGSFRPVTHVNVDMATCGNAAFASEEDVDADRIVTLAELTMANLMNEGGIDTTDFLARVDMLGSLGFNVLISNYLRYFKLRAYFNRYTQRKIGIVLGVANIYDIFNEDFYSDMEGGILEAFGKLFAGNVRLYAYPQLDKRSDSNGLMTVDSIQVKKEVSHLLTHLIDNKCIVSLDNCNIEHLNLRSRDVLQQLRRGDGAWAEAVPEAVHQAIVQKRLFGYGSE